MGNTVEQLHSFLPESTYRQILDLYKKSKDISPYSSEANAIASEIVAIFESLPQILERIERKPALSSRQANPKKVFVVHGRNSAARTQMFIFLRALGLEPIEWSQAINLANKGTPFIGEVLDSAFAVAQAVVVLLTGDDEARLKSEYQTKNEPEHEKNLTPQARPNVLFEAGMAFGIHPDRTILVEIGVLRPFSDVAGRHSVKLSDRAQGRLELKNRLKNAGCELDDSGTDWITVGTFDS